MKYVLGYTCGNDVSARTQQFKNGQWCFSIMPESRGTSAHRVSRTL